MVPDKFFSCFVSNANDFESPVGGQNLFDFISGGVIPAHLLDCAQPALRKYFDCSCMMATVMEADPISRDARGRSARAGAYLRADIMIVLKYGITASISLTVVSN